MACTGSASSRLMMIRGNSGSGKSCPAQAIRDARPRGFAIIGHDVLRRQILHVRDHPGALSVDYLDLSARFALDHDLHVIIEGILHSESYGDMLTRRRDDHRGITRCYRYDLTLEETLVRHRTKPLAAEVPEDTVRSWYRSDDSVVGLDETRFDANVSLEAALRTVLTDVGWSETGASTQEP